MAKSEDIGKLVATTEVVSLQKLIESSAKELARALPDHMQPERLVRIALTCVRLNPDLAKTTKESFLGALFTAAQIGLEPVGGRAYLLPFNNSRKINGEWTTVKETQLVIGYKGLIELFYRHNAALSIDFQNVHAGDDFTYQFGTEAFLRHTPALTDRGEVIAYYAIAKIKGGGTVFYVISKAAALTHAKKHSKTWDKKKEEFYASSPWSKEFDAMAMKTAMIQLAKKLPLSIELQRAIAADETSRDFRKGVEDALDLPSTTSWDESEGDAHPADKPADTAKPAPANPPYEPGSEG